MTLSPIILMSGDFVRSISRSQSAICLFSFLQASLALGAPHASVDTKFANYIIGLYSVGLDCPNLELI